MYESFYGLKEKPFSMLPDPGFLYLSKKHLKALTLFEYGLMNHAGFCVISGEIGSGKTTLLRKLLENMSRKITVGMITNTHKQFGELLDWVLSAFDIHEKGLNEVEKHQRFVDFLLEQYAARKTTLLIVDEAQNMSADKLEELRMLSNINSGKDQVLQIILAGQPELKDTLRLPELKQFVQRIAVDYHLSSLNEEETRGYISHRLTVAGAEKEIFTEQAANLIYKYSGGTPRLINLLCDTAMVYGFADQQDVIEEDLVAEMIHERMQDSLVPLAHSELPKKKIREELVDEKSTADIDESLTSSDDVENAETTESDFGEKVMQAAASENEAELDQGAEVDVSDVEAEGVFESDSETDTESESEAEPEFSEEVSTVTISEELGSESESATDEFLQQNKTSISRFLQPVLLGLAALIIVTLFFALSIDDETGQTISSADVNEHKENSEKNDAVTTIAEPVISDSIKQQLDEAKIIQEEMKRKQQEDLEKLKALQEQATKLQGERDTALKKAKTEEKKRTAEAREAKNAAKREAEAQKIAQEAIAETIATTHKMELMEELRAKEELAKAKQAEEDALKAQQEAIESAEMIETEVEEAAVVETEELKGSVDARCDGPTARFLSICR